MRVLYCLGTDIVGGEGNVRSEGGLAPSELKELSADESDHEQALLLDKNSLPVLVDVGDARTLSASREVCREVLEKVKEVASEEVRRLR